jgi:hypothetical protein
VVPVHHPTWAAGFATGLMVKDLRRARGGRDREPAGSPSSYTEIWARAEAVIGPADHTEIVRYLEEIAGDPA